MNTSKKISLLFLCAITSIASLQAKPNKQQITINNMVQEELSAQITWKMREAPHTQRLQDISLLKDQTISIKAPISGYDLEEIKVYYTKGINDAMKTSQKSHGNTYFIIKAGSRYAKDSGEKRRHLIVKGYQNEDAYKQLLAKAATAVQAQQNTTQNQNNIFPIVSTGPQAQAAGTPSTQTPASSTFQCGSTPSQCDDGSTATCADRTIIANQQCDDGVTMSDVNGFCSNDGSLIACNDGINDPTCTDGSYPC